MELLCPISNPLALRVWIGMLAIALLMLDSYAVQGQEPVIFQYSDANLWEWFPLEVPGAPGETISAIQESNITCLGDFQQTTFCVGDNSCDTLARELAMNGTESGRCLYNTPVQLTQYDGGLMSFSTMFEVYITPGFQVAGTDPTTGNPEINATLQGLAFIIGSDDSSQGDGGGYLGWLSNTTNDETSGHNFAVEIDFFQDLKFNDPAGAHIGVDHNSLTSLGTITLDKLGAFLWNDGDQSKLAYGCVDPSNPMTSIKDFVVVVWVDYDGPTHNLSVYAQWTNVYFNAPPFTKMYYSNTVGYVVSSANKPPQPSISTIIDLTETFSGKDMFIGFSASARGDYYIRVWTFNSNGQAPALAPVATVQTSLETGSTSTSYIPLLVTMIVEAAVSSVSVSVVLGLVIVMLYKKNSKLTALAERYQIEEDQLDQGPQKFRYRDLARGTKEFNVKAKLGEGGFGSVYKGTLPLKKGGSLTDIAVKRISAASKQGEREFLAEVKIIGQAQHRNLVRLLGWCHEKGELLLVYEYMPNGSVHDLLYRKTPGGPVLTWTRRIMILSGVAKALAFLHEEWEHRVIHRDVKSSNVMLDGDFNARLGDFGLARLSEHDQTIPFTEAMAGTYGYIAPELLHTYTPTEKTDVYSFGATMLEIASGKKPLLSQEDKESLNQTLLVDWVWALYGDNSLLEAADPALNNAYDPGEMAMFLKIALLCSHPDPDQRPHMREVINIWRGSSPLPRLPLSKPLPVFAILDFDGHPPLKIIADQCNSLPEEKVEGQIVAPDTTLGYYTTSSLPF